MSFVFKKISKLKKQILPKKSSIIFSIMKILAVESIRKRNLNSVHGKFEILDHMRSHNLKSHTNTRIFPFNLKTKWTSGTTWKCFQGQQPPVRGRRCTTYWQKQSVTLSKTVPFSLLLSLMSCPHLPSAYGYGVTTQSTWLLSFSIRDPAAYSVPSCRSTKR